MIFPQDSGQGQGAVQIHQVRNISSEIRVRPREVPPLSKDPLRSSSVDSTSSKSLTLTWCRTTNAFCGLSEISVSPRFFFFFQRTLVVWCSLLSELSYHQPSGSHFFFMFLFLFSPQLVPIHIEQKRRIFAEDISHTGYCCGCPAWG